MHNKSEGIPPRFCYVLCGTPLRCHSEASPQGRGSTPPAVLRSHSLASPFGRGGRAQRGRRGQTMTIPALSVTCGDSSPKGRAKGLHSSTECLHVIRFGRGRAPPLHSVYRTCALSLPCHSEPVTDVTGVGIRPPFYASGGQRPPPTFAASRQRRDLIIATSPGVRFPKGRGRTGRKPSERKIV